MLNNKVIKKVIDELKAISKIDLCVINSDGNICATTFKTNFSKDYIIDFFKSKADMISILDYNFFKVIDEKITTYVVVTNNVSEDAYMIGKICVSELKNLIIAYKDKLDEQGYIRSLLLDSIPLQDIYRKAKKLNIENDKNRVVIIVKPNNNDGESLELIKNIFYENDRDFITTLDEKSIIIIKNIGKDNSYKQVEKIANILVDMINTEVMVKVKVSYGTVINDIKDISKSYKEANMSMELLDIFYKNKNILGYNTLGIGRLIYELPINICEIFLKEIFKNNLLTSLDQELLVTVYKFFDNNLNIAETSRNLFIHRNTLVYRLEKIEKITGLDVKLFEEALTFKLALMVSEYVNYVKKNNK